MGIVLLVLLSEIVSIIGVNNIITNGAIKALNEISDKGLRIDKSKLKKESTIEDDIINLNFSVKNLSSLTKLSLLIPGINLITASVINKKFKKGLEESEDFQKCLVPMSEYEKAGYKDCVTKEEKMRFFLMTAQLEEDQELLGFEGGQAFVHDSNLTVIREEPLIHMAYTFDDVKRLNAATGNTYRIGKVNGINTAIIGILGDDYQIKKIALGENQKHYEFVPMTEEEAKNQKFVVYPVTKEDEEATREVIRDILRDREAKEKETRMSHIRSSEQTKNQIKSEGRTLKK